MKFELSQLPYAYNALEPYIDAQTMEIHHAKHHQAYIDKLNTVVEKYSTLADMSVEDLLKTLKTLEVDEVDRIAIQNHGGGHANHAFFWDNMAPQKQGDETLKSDIELAFGSTDAFKQEFAKAAVSRFGSGWAWLVRDEDNALKVYSTANQDSPLSQGHTPIIGLDVWEHAYYLKYQNRRQEYIDNWWSVVKVL
ncbi:MAG: superoxide dismutase [Candidatus Jacksonbacteria bacterium RIFCSPLOWO2_02_FULL_43_9]|nr:MAG: Superoxide dismutase [Parcubacteria group bacterium GW2011_GWA2_43_13]OGY68745.1 MAG: superoxide dismutase [Candidatus Jacksonbacteria bacterium RIFCSPHIGHO2_02_FULL_43_10]OGY71054.1 MAG: superoxide dismutase [Candidatus Jacksonbacteria bacterium RIFCSPLOWO2_01_FULL_44_13]OGY73844.1 MAG: superoxide dismutase [Candidatus Jacksonbacteria bacterium RIFCSPLOWO2_02_FULL_43_9]HAZ16875.1 superoxide dismutase [Candidatus Jacksonbacteria bacterium]